MLNFSHEIPYPDDRARCAHLYRLHVAEDYPGLIASAREALSGSIDRFCDAPPYAAYLLGHYGNESDLPALTRLYLTPGLHPLARQVSLDAIERIQERGRNA